MHGHSRRVRSFLLALVLCVSGCATAERAADTSAPVETVSTDTGHVGPWSDDADTGQLPRQPAWYFASCIGTPLVTPDSLGPVRPGRSLAAITARCPRQFRYWHWEEGVPQPAIALNVGGALLRVLLEDSLPTSVVDRVLSSDSSARTAKSIGPGSTIADVEHAYGRLKFETAKCAIYASSPAHAGVSWIVTTPAGWDCEDLVDVHAGKRRPPGSTVVHTAAVYRRAAPPATVTCATRPVPVGTDSIGPMPRGATIAQLRQLCAATDSVASGFETEHPAIVFRFGTLRVLAYQRTRTLDESAAPDAWRVLGCGGVLFAKVSTCATWTEIVDAFGMAGTGSSEFGPAVITLEGLRGVQLEFDVTGQHVGSLEVQPDLSRMPGRARLVQITY
jgi:hypothetical protein